MASINWPLNVAIGFREVTETETLPEIQLREISTLLTQGKVLMRLDIFRTSMRARRSPVFKFVRLLTVCSLLFVGAP